MTTTLSPRLARFSPRLRAWMAQNLEECLTRNGGSLMDGDRVLIAAMRSDTPAMTAKEAQIRESWDKVVAATNAKNFPEPYRGEQ